MKKALTGAILSCLVGSTVGATISVSANMAQPHSGVKKHVVFVAGPRRSDATAVDRFFQTYALDETGNGLDGWIWPNITQVLPGQKHQYFENFFWNAKNATIQTILMEGIKDAWEDSQYGIILGAEGFENTRGDPRSASLQVMHKIVDALHVAPEHVHVVLMYQAPRLKQWASLFEHNKVGDGSYKEFVCESSYTDNLATISMNPFMLANVFLRQGWKVAAIDAMGVDEAGLDLAHAVACNVLPNVKCVNETIVGLEHELIIHDENTDFESFRVLPTDEAYDLEGIFQTRDCYYQTSAVANANFSFVHMSGIWEECGGEMTNSERESFQELAKDVNFLNLIKAQERCSTTLQQSPQPAATTSSTHQVQVDHTLTSREKTLVGGVMLISMFVMYQIIARHKRRQTHTVKSPRTGEDVWSDFANDAAHIENLRGVSSEDESFSDVDLRSPGFKRSPRGSEASSMAEAAKEGRSVRGMYRVGLYQNSPSSKHKPHRGDSDFEFKIKSLEREFA